MSQSNYITLALFAVIGLVFIIDFFKKRKEDSLDKSVEKFTSNKNEDKSLFFLDFIIFTIIVFVLFVSIIWLTGRFIPEIPFYKPTDYHRAKFYDFIILYSWIPAFLSIVVGRYIFIKKIGFFISTNNNTLQTTFNKFLNKILERKKNITFSILLILFFKVVIHYFFYRKYSRSFGDHMDKVFTAKEELFLPVTIVFLIVVWFFNDKIKAQ